MGGKIVESASVFCGGDKNSVDETSLLLWLLRRPCCTIELAGIVFRARQRVGKYRIERRLASGGFAVVYRAMDTIEGRRVALKIPHAAIMSEDVLKDFRAEVRLTARLDHENILPLKNASFIDNNFVIVFPLGEKSLAERLRSRMSLQTTLGYAEQMTEAVSYAHRQRIIHCDIKPENFILFPENRLRLTDFGIAKVAQRTVRAAGTGTIGYMAPEQAMGKPSLRSDVFSLGIVLYRMLAGAWPEWPYEWPPPGIQKLRRRAHPELIAFLRKAIDIKPRNRFADAIEMCDAFRTVKEKTLKLQATRRRRERNVRARKRQ